MAGSSKPRWGKWLLYLIILGAAGAGGYWYFTREEQSPTEYQVSTVARGSVIQAVTATGQLNPVVNVQVGSQVSGIIRKIYVDYNSVVKSNQVIAEIDPSTYQMAVLRAEAQLANSKANLSLAQVQARRGETLFAGKLISASEHDTAQAQLQQADALVQSDQAALQNAKVQLSYCTIYAPVDGVVISRSIDVGQTVASSFNTPTLFVIAGDLTKMQIDALVSEADIGGVTVEQNVNFTVDAHPYRTFKGQVRQVRYGAITNQNVVNYDCVVGVENGDLKLLPGMTANVSITTAERGSALKIPNAALRFRPPETTTTTNTAQSASGSGQGPASGTQRKGGERSSDSGKGGPGAGGSSPGMRAGGGAAEAGTFTGRQRVERQTTRTVYVLQGDSDPRAKQKAEPKPVQVKIGISDGVNTEVIEGLKEGDSVVTGMISPSTSGAGQRPANPFGGGPGIRRF